MNVDVAAMLQGVHNARNEKKIPAYMHSAIVYAIVTIAKPAYVVGRSEIDHGEMLCLLAGIEGFPAHRWAMLWPYLGKSIAEGLVIASDVTAGE